METSDKKMGKIFPVFVGVCILALPLIIFAALSVQPQGPATTITRADDVDFDHDGGNLVGTYTEMTEAYLKAASPVRTLEEYYSRRQYAGSPPFIPHKVEDDRGEAWNCLTCHEKGGWTQELRRHTPLTPHPEKTECRQCHVPMDDPTLFMENMWVSAPPPKLGRSHLPGGPPPVPHALQMRENCVACHVGPGAVEGIRSNHPDRGNCRQCHVSDQYKGLFERLSDQ